MGQILHGSARTTEAVRRATAWSREPEGSGEASWHQPEDHRQVEEAYRSRMYRQGLRTFIRRC